MRSSNCPIVFLKTRLDVALRIKRSASLNASSLSLLLLTEVTILRLEVVAENLFPSVEHLLFVEE